MDIILMLGFIVGGIYILTTGKIPSWLIGENRNLSPNHSRWLGIMLIVTVPIVFLGLFLLPIFLGEDSILYTVLFEWGILILVSLLFIILARNLGKKNESPLPEPVKLIKRKAEGALYYAVFSIAGIPALVCCPLAIVYANQAIKMIDEQSIGEEYRSTAKNGRLIAIISLALWGLALLALLVILIVGNSVG